MRKMLLLPSFYRWDMTLIAPGQIANRWKSWYLIFKVLLQRLHCLNHYTIRLCESSLVSAIHGDQDPVDWSRERHVWPSLPCSRITPQRLPWLHRGLNGFPGPLTLSLAGDSLWPMGCSTMWFVQELEICMHLRHTPLSWGAPEWFMELTQIGRAPHTSCLLYSIMCWSSSWAGLVNDTPGELSGIRGAPKGEAVFELAPLLFLGHWHEDVVPRAGHHLVTTGKSTKTKGQHTEDAQAERRTGPRSWAILSRPWAITHPCVFWEKQFPLCSSQYSLGCLLFTVKAIPNCSWLC